MRAEPGRRLCSSLHSRVLDGPGGCGPVHLALPPPRPLHGGHDQALGTCLGPALSESSTPLRHRSNPLLPEGAVGS